MEDQYWREQPGWMRDISLAAVYAALAAEQPYAAHSEVRKDAYGSKATNISDQYEKYVPPEFVLDRFEPPNRGCPGSLKLCNHTTLLSLASTEATARSMQAASEHPEQPSAASAHRAPKKIQWSAAMYKKLWVQALRAPFFNGTMPKKHSD